MLVLTQRSSNTQHIAICMQVYIAADQSGTRSDACVHQNCQVNVKSVSQSLSYWKKVISWIFFFLKNLLPVVHNHLLSNEIK